MGLITCANENTSSPNSDTPQKRNSAEGTPTSDHKCGDSMDEMDRDKNPKPPEKRGRKQQFHNGEACGPCVVLEKLGMD